MNEVNCIKTFKVDKGIKPLIDWLNSIPNVYTLYSCESHNDNEEAYVSIILQCNVPPHANDIGKYIKTTLTSIGLKPTFLYQSKNWKICSQFYYNRVIRIGLGRNLNKKIFKRLKNVRYSSNS